MISSLSGSQSALYSGLQGFKQGEAKVTQAASDIASRSDTVDINKSVVDLSAGSLQAQASAKVIDKSDEMLGTLIDTLA